jgi:hypothetical protein
MQSACRSARPRRRDTLFPCNAFEKQEGSDAACVSVDCQVVASNQLITVEDQDGSFFYRLLEFAANRGSPIVQVAARLRLFQQNQRVSSGSKWVPRSPV